MVTMHGKLRRYFWNARRIVSHRVHPDEIGRVDSRSAVVRVLCGKVLSQGELMDEPATHECFRCEQVAQDRGER